MKQKDAELKRKLTGADGFESFYSSLFGTRWQSLKAALAQDPLYVRQGWGDSTALFHRCGERRRCPLSARRPA